ncbi:MAG: hypothetical protein J4A00_09425 [Gammaproteobacteria bacterium]|nr:hypothetical protein [Gammaproteobacteria bacterium]
MTVGKPIKICVFGVDSRVRGRLEQFLAAAAGDRCELVEAVEAEVGLVTYDDIPDGAEWSDYRARFPSRLTIVIGQQDPKQSGVYFLQNPIKKGNLLRLLDLIGERLRKLAEDGELSKTLILDIELAASLGIYPSPELGGAAAVKVEADNDPLSDNSDRTQVLPGLVDLKTRQTAPAWLYFDPQTTPLGWLKDSAEQALESDRAIRLDIGERYLLVLPKRHQVLTSFDNESLIRLCQESRQDAPSSVEWLTDAEVETVLANPQSSAGIRNLEPLLWSVAVWSARGRLPEGADPAQRVYLSRWPNFPRLLETPYAMQVAALWVQQAMSLEFLVDTLKIPHQSVYDLYTAAWSIGLAGPARRREDFLFQPDEGQWHPKSRFAHLIRNLGRTTLGGGERGLADDD